MAAFYGVFIFVFLIVFKPFQLDDLNWDRLLLITFIYGAVTFTCVLAPTALLPLIFPNYFNEKSWTTGKQIFLIAVVFFLVGIVNYLVSPLIVNTKWNITDAIWFQGITLAVGLLPVSIFILLQQNRLVKKFSAEAELIEEKLFQKNQFLKEVSEEPVQQNTFNKVILVGDYQNEKLELFADDLHFINSASNYIKVYYMHKGKLIYSMIRSTLKKTEEALAGHARFYKCHRAFIINLDKVVHVEGNAQGYKIKIEGCDDLLPVSRNQNSEFSDKLLSFRKNAPDQ